MLPASAAAQDPQPVDYATQVQPILDASCAGALCHVGMQMSGVELTSYETVMASLGFQYDGPVVVPFSAADSALWDKVASEMPRFGVRMPRGREPLGQTEIDLIGRWIDEGARPSTAALLRGDVDHSGRRDISDAIGLLGYLFLGGSPPYCAPVADANSDTRIDLTDAVYILGHLFLGGPEPEVLSGEEEASCTGSNRPPEPQPLGTVLGREGVLLEFSVEATDPDGDAMIYRVEALPDGAELDVWTGRGRWTPRFGQAGDHRVRIRVTDNGRPPLSTLATGLIRVLRGNHPPDVEPVGTRYGREEVALEFRIMATDVEGKALAFELLAGPPGSAVHPDTGVFRWAPPAGSAGDHPLRVRVSDSGSPPQSSEVEGLIVVLAANSPVNQPPFVPRHDVYRTYPGREVRLTIGASDPDGHALRYKAGSLPDGAALDEQSGVLTWIPAGDQLGPSYVPFTVTDDGLPPESVDGLLIFQVAPPDPCTEPVCDPATGCDPALVPISVGCCAGEPRVRVPEPVAGCPEGRVLHVGRNNRGFGRLQNCDRLPVISFAQGGSNVRLHVEARCVDTARQVNVRARLETADRVVFESERTVFLRERSDGFAQRLALIFAVNPGVPLVFLEGAQALLTVTLTDFDGIVLTKRLRLTLTLRAVPDLPDPDSQDVPAGEAGCVGCHRPRGPTGEREGIEDAHPWYPLTCTDCHGGNPDAVTRSLAHVPVLGPRFLRNLTSDQLDTTPLLYLQFVNPADSRVAGRGCGAANPANPGSGCHQRLVDFMPLSVMSTYAGHYSLPRFLAGSQGREALYAAVDRRDPNFDPATAPAGAVSSFEALREPDVLADRSTVGVCMDVYLPKSCPTCHLSDFGRNNAAGNYRSSGCTACHMVYADDGLSRSADPMISKDFPPHPRTHVLTSAIPTEQCSHCHFQGGRIGLAFRGIREGGFSAERTPENGITLGKELHGHAADYYFVDEDDTDDVDETPPDVHHAAGMVCADCHVGVDVHGDGRMYSSERYQVGIRCEDCHGTVRAAIREDPAVGFFKSSGGSLLRRIRRTDDDRIVLRLAMEDRELEIPQIQRILESGVNQAMSEAMGVNERGFSHTDRLECFSCHTSWRQTCFGCHVTIDDSRAQLNHTTGEESQGAVSVTRDDYSLDFFALGVNHRGKITPLCSSMSVFMSYVDETGTMRYRDRVRTSTDGRIGFGWNPFHHHTVSRVPQNCDRCHPVAPGAGADNSGALRETYGFGNRKHLATDGTGVEYDLSAFLNDAGELTAEFPHPESGPVPKTSRDRAMSIQVVPHPRR